MCTVVKSKSEISQNFVAFSEYMNFNIRYFEIGLFSTSNYDIFVIIDVHLRVQILALFNHISIK